MWEQKEGVGRSTVRTHDSHSGSRHSRALNLSIRSLSLPCDINGRVHAVTLGQLRVVTVVRTHVCKKKKSGRATIRTWDLSLARETNGRLFQRTNWYPEDQGQDLSGPTGVECLNH